MSPSSLIPQRGSNIDGRTTHHPGYAASQVIRKRIEEANGWIQVRGQDDADEVPPRGAGRLDVTVEGCRVQPHPAAKIAGCRMSLSKCASQAIATTIRMRQTR